MFRRFNSGLAAIALCLAACTALFSCVKNDRRTASDIIPLEYLLRTGMDTLVIPVQNRYPDSVQSTNLKNMLVGELSDPVFGSVISSSASLLLPYSDSTQFVDSTSVINIYATLSVDSIFNFQSTDEGIPLAISLHKMLTPLDSTNNFNTSLKEGEDYEARPLNLFKTVLYGGTSAVDIEIDPDFGTELLQLRVWDCKDIPTFTQKIKGIYIKAESGGKLLGFKLGSSTLTLRYYITDYTRKFNMKDTTETFALGYSYAVNSFSNTKSVDLTDENPDYYIYLDGLVGVKPFIDAKVAWRILQDWVEENVTMVEGDRLIFNRVLLRLPVLRPYDYTQFDREYPPTIYAFTQGETTTNTQTTKDTVFFMRPIPDFLSVSSPGTLDRTRWEYGVDITQWCQDLVDTDSEDELLDGDNLWIGPVSNNMFDNGGYKRVTLHGNKAESHPTVEITYTVVPL